MSSHPTPLYVLYTDAELGLLTSFSFTSCLSGILQTVALDNRIYVVVVVEVA
jgi:hypothetical protein